jgi:opacity protein-like surface antigen
MKKFAIGAAIAAAIMSLSVAASAQEQKEYKWFAGPTVGSTWTQGSNLGFNGGYQINKYFALEANYDHVFNQWGNAPIDLATGNVVAGYPIAGTKLTPYVLAGLGYQFQWNANQGVFNVGGGTKIDIAKDINMDVRYRYAQGFSNQQNENIVSVGFGFKF